MHGSSVRKLHRHSSQSFPLKTWSVLSSLALSESFLAELCHFHSQDWLIHILKIYSQKNLFSFKSSFYIGIWLTVWGGKGFEFLSWRKCLNILSPVDMTQVSKLSNYEEVWHDFRNSEWLLNFFKHFSVPLCWPRFPSQSVRQQQPFFNC